MMKRTGEATSLRLTLSSTHRLAARLISELLDRVDVLRPQETEIGIDLRYATAMFEIPFSAPCDWRAVLHRPAAQNGRGGLLVPIENNRWQVNLTGIHGQLLPESIEEFIAFAKTLRTQTIHDAIKDAVPIGPIHRFAFPGSTRRHFERLDSFQIVSCRSVMRFVDLIRPSVKE